MANLEKWVDELQAAVDKLTKRVASAAASAFKPEITTPTDGQVIMYDDTSGSWVNGYATPPTPEPPAEYALIDTGVPQVPVLFSNDGVSGLTTGAIALKSGGGTFFSYVNTVDPIDLTDYDTMTVSYKYKNTDMESTIDISALTGSMSIGVGFWTEVAGNQMCVTAADAMTPFNPVKQIPFDSLTYDASGDVLIYDVTISKILTEAKKKTTKKGGTK